jgi:hypothetical protein
MAITLPVSGSYEAVRGLLDQLLELPVFLVVDGIGLQTMSATASPLGRTPAAGAPIRVDLSLSVFVDDQELASGLRRPPATPVSASANRAADTLRQAARSEDPDDIADVLMTQLAALPPLPIDADQLIIDIDQLDEPVEAVAPSRNLFSVVTAPVTAPPPIAFAGAAEMPVPEASFPVRLVGVLKIDGRWHASLTDDVEVFVAAAGDRLSNGVQVIEVGADYVDVEFGDRRTRLTLEGSRP